VAVQTGRVVDLAKEVLRDFAQVQGVLKAVCQEAEVPFRWGRGDLDQGVKVDRDREGEGEVLDSREAGVPCVREGAASCDLAGEVHRDH
jgi:hypothetical protein